MGSIEAGFEPRPTKPLGLVVAPGGEERFDPGPLPVVGSPSFQRESPLILEISGGRRGWRSLLQENEGFLGTSGREQAVRDRGGCVWGSSAGFQRDERVDVTFVVGDALQGAVERARCGIEAVLLLRAFRQRGRQSSLELGDARTLECRHDHLDQPVVLAIVIPRHGCEDPVGELHRIGRRFSGNSTEILAGLTEYITYVATAVVDTI